MSSELIAARARWRRWALILLTALFVGAVPAPSRANDAKVFGGTMCATHGNDAGGLEFLSVGVRNISGALLMLECDLDRDNTGNTNGLADLELTVTDPRGRLVCDAYSMDRNGNVLAMSERFAAGPGTQVLDFGNSLNISASKGYYHISCFMDNGTRLHAIYADEF